MNLELLSNPIKLLKDEDQNTDLEGIMTAKEVDTKGLREKVCALRENCCSGSLEFSSDMFAVVALVKRSLKLKRQATKQEKSLVEVRQKLQVASSAVL